MTHNELSEDEIELLLEARRKDDPAVVEQADLDAATEVLAWAVAEARDLVVEDATELPLSVLAKQIDREIESQQPSTAEQLAAAAQMPETERAAPDDLEDDQGDEPPAEAISLLAKAEALESRLPEHAEALRQEAAELCGVDDTDDIDVADDVLRRAFPAN